MAQLPFDFQAAISVGELQRRLRAEIERGFARVFVAGEISNLTVHRQSGHAYFTLKDQEAQLKCVMWRDNLRRVRFQLEDGQLAICEGRPTVYEKSGQLQMAVSRVELQGLGALQEAYRQLAEKLRGEGLTAASRKRPLPAWPRTVGVVTSREAAALRDVLRTILRRDPFAHVVVSFTPVQGDGSAPEIAEALARIDALGVCQVILLVRGGGSVEDLWAFNREPVARAICACRVPVVTGVGHETDTTIADLVADRSCSTPTAAAEVVMPVRSEMRAAWLQREARLHRAMDTIVQALGRRLSRIEARITDPQPMIHRRAQRIDELSLRAERNLRDRLASSRRDIADLSARLESTSPRMRVRGQSARLDLLHARLDRAIERRIERTRQRFARTAARLGDLSPLAILSRGYAVVHDGAGHVVRSASEVSPGDRLAVRLGEGTIRVLVQTDQDR